MLTEPRCTPQQLSHFLSYFSTLDNIKIWQILNGDGVRATLRPVPPRHQPQMGVRRNGLILRLTDHVNNYPTLTTLGGPE